MKPQDLSNYDASTRAQSELQSVLHREQKAISNEGKISVEEALKQQRIVTTTAQRSALRVLFISQDTTLLNPSTQSLDGFLDLRDLFEEVHILILRAGIPAKNPTLRVADNVWLYTASAKTWWMLPKQGALLAEQEMAFAGGFRPDLIVARDPFESALVGKTLSLQYHKPFQIHVLSNYTGEAFRREAAKNFWRRFIPRFTLPFAVSVRAETKEMADIIAAHVSVPDLAILPRYHSYESLVQTTEATDLARLYEPLRVFIVYIGSLGFDSTLFRTLDAARFILQNRRVGLLVIGNGPAKAEFQKRAKILGVERQVVFESRVEKAVAHLKSGHILMVTDTTKEADDLVLLGAVAGIPMVLASNEFRKGLFESGVSAYLCEPENTQQIANALSRLLNDPQMRQIVAKKAKTIILERFHQDVYEYREAFQKSLEEAIFVEDSQNQP